MLLLRTQLKRVEAIEAFADFLRDGIEHISVNGGSARDPNDAKATVQLSDTTVAKMKDIQYDVSVIVKELETGLKDMTYSTVAEDYAENRDTMN